MENTPLDETRDPATQSEPRKEIKLVLGCRHVNWQHIHCPVYVTVNVQRFWRSRGQPPWLHITAPHFGNEEGPCVIFLRPCFPFALPIIGTRVGSVQSFNLVLRGAISFQSKAHKLPQSTRQVLINIQTFAFKSSPIYSSFPSICETWQSHTGLLFVGGPRGEEYYGGYYRRLPVRLGVRRSCATVAWGQGGAAACSKESILNLCWWPGSSLLTLSPASWSAAWSQCQIFGDIRSSPLHHNGPGAPPVQL